MTNDEDVKGMKNDDTKSHHHGGYKLAMIIGVLVVVGASGLALSTLANHFNVRRNQAYCFHDDFRGGYGMMGGGRHMGGYGREDYDSSFRDSIRTSGEITKINGNTITVNDGVNEITVNVTSSTSYVKLGKISKQTDLQVGNSIVAFGTSDSNGVLTATRIIIR